MIHIFFGGAEWSLKTSPLCTVSRNCEFGLIVGFVCVELGVLLRGRGLEPCEGLLVNKVRRLLWPRMAQNVTQRTRGCVSSQGRAVPETTGTWSLAPKSTQKHQARLPLIPDTWELEAGKHLPAPSDLSRSYLLPFLHFV